MKSFAPLLTILLLTCTVALGEEPGKPRIIPSPDKHFLLVFTGMDRFEIQNSDGKAILDSNSFPKLETIAEFRPGNACWSPDSQILAIAGGGGHNLDTFIFVRQGSTFIQVPVPDITSDYDNSYITPFKWISGGRIIVDISGPHAGKRITQFYRGKATLCVFSKSLSCEVVYKKITEYSETEEP